MNDKIDKPCYPLAELHVHLDGSLRLGTLVELALEQGIFLPEATPTGLEEKVFKPFYGSLEEYLAGFGLTCSVMGTASAVRRIAKELFLDAALDGVRYMEVRMAPQLLARPGFDVVDVLKAMDDGMREAEATLSIGLPEGKAPFCHSIIACAMRHVHPGMGEVYRKLFEHDLQSREVVVEAARLLFEDVKAAREQGLPVTGVDLAGSEVLGPAEPFGQLFSSAGGSGLGITIHAGEARGAGSIDRAIHGLGARRIGHGTALLHTMLDRADDGPVDRKHLIATARDDHICFEVCIKSNCDTGAIKSVREHPLKAMLNEGIEVCLNTDNRLVSHTTLIDEFVRARALGLSENECRILARNGFRHAFFPGTESEHKAYCRAVELESTTPCSH